MLMRRLISDVLSKNGFEIVGQAANGREAVEKYKDLSLFEEASIGRIQRIVATAVGCHFKQLASDATYVKEHEEDFP